METITDSDFESVVIESDKPVVVDFFTEHCGPCKLVAPMLEELSKEMDTVSFVKFDASEGEIPVGYGIVSVPTLVLFKDRREFDRKVGLFPKAKLKEWIEENTC